MNNQKSGWINHLLIILGFFLLSVVYFYPVIEGKTLQQGDIIHAKGVNHYGIEYSKKTGHRPCWSPQLFSGMPSYQVSGTKKNNFVFITIHRTIRLLGSTSIAIMFLYFLGFYILMLSLGVDKWLSAIGALAYGLGTYNIIIIGAGHITKAYSLGYMPIVVAGFMLIYKKNYKLGSILALLGLGLMINLGHLQIVYYTALLLGLYVLTEFIWSLIQKRIKDFLIASGISLGIAILAVLPNTVGLWQAYEMSKYSIRGPSELTDSKKNTGLNKDYALSWSYGITESLSLFIPNIKGGATGYLQNDDVAMNNVSPQYKDLIAQQNHYWGEQPFTSGPVYFGAIVIFFALLGMFFIKEKKILVWLLLATIFSIVLSWGKNFPAITDFFFYNFPFYNKFRTVSMILVIAGLTIPMMAILGLNEILTSYKDKTLSINPLKDKNLRYGFYTALALTVGLALLFLLFAGNFDFVNSTEQQYFNSIRQQNLQIASRIDPLITELVNARKAVFTHDVFRSLFYSLIGFALVWIFFAFKNKSSAKNILLTGLALAVLFDLFIVDKRYLKNSDFQPKKKLESQFFKPTYANQFILKDKDPDFRVVNITTNPFTDAITSYFHFNIGGYHGAKLRRYQDIIDYYLGGEVYYLQKAFSDTVTDVNMALSQTQVLNMLNTKYIIFNPNTIPYLNKFAFGNAWFVRNIKFVSSPKEEIEALKNVNLRTTAVVDKNKFRNYDFPALDLTTNIDSAKITLVKFSPDTLVYEYYAPEKLFAVFSEVYYPKGWKLLIDDQASELVRCNYILRGATLPAGKHKITMIFKPKACYVAQTIALTGSILVLFVLAGLFYLLLKDKKSKNETQTNKDEKN